jgi:hypothetical protein
MLEIALRTLTCLATPSDIEAIQRTAPEPVAADVAAEHHLGACLAEGELGVDRDLILSIDAHESRYSAARTAEAGGKTSCGPMTPIPKARCAQPSTIDGIREGAAHLREWLADAHVRGDMRRALLGYAGGYPLLAACDRGPYFVTRAGRQIDLCRTPDVFWAGAARIRGTRDRARRRVGS